MMWDGDTPQYSIHKEPWHAWFAWYPVKVENKYVWLRNIFRREVSDFGVGVSFIQYGNLFDVLKDS